jgi:hypothetical protein
MARPNANRAQYEQSRMGAVILVEDLGDGARSVTNDAEAVVAAMARKYDDLDKCVIIYRDSEGRWDCLDHAGGAFREFVMIGAHDLSDAMAWANARIEEAARS